MRTFLVQGVGACVKLSPDTTSHQLCTTVQGGWGGWPTGNGKKQSCSQAQLGQATCLAVA